MDALWQDVRYGVRTLRRNSTFTAVATLVFAVGIGANTAIFSIINAVLFRPPSVLAPHELVYMNVTSHYQSGWQWAGISYRDYQHLSETVGVFDDVLTYSSDSARIGTGRDRQYVRGERVSANYFSVLGVQPALGRPFDPGDNRRDAAPVVIVSHAFWQGALRADPEVLGRRIELDDHRTMGRSRPYTIIGVVAPDFKGVANTWAPTEYWVPTLSRGIDLESWCEPPFIADRRGALIGRLKPGVAFDVAQRTVLGKRSELEDPPDTNEWSLVVRDSKPSDRLPFAGTGRLIPERLAGALMIVTTIVLLIAAANLTGVLMARGLARRHELAIRLTLGAGRWRIVRQSLIEGLLLAASGGLVGLWLSRVLMQVFVATIPNTPGQFSTSILLDVPLDARVVLFTTSLCVLAGGLVSIGPARLATRIGILGALSGSAMATPRDTRSVLRYTIVIPQVCLSLVLLLVSGALIKSLVKVELIDPGYEPTGLVFLEIGIPGPTLCDREKSLRPFVEHRQSFERRLLETARALPSATTTALATSVPFQNGSSQSVITREGYAGGQNRWIARQNVTPGYFETLRIPVVHGRDFDARDTRDATAVAVVSQSLAQLLWNGGDPVGDAIAFYDPTNRNQRYAPTWKTVVGVVGDVRESIGVLGNATIMSDGSPKPTVYVPLEQGSYGMILLARGQSDARLLQDLADAVSASDPDAEVYRTGTVTQAIGEILYPRRVGAAILSGAGIIGLLLASMGLYGVVSFSVGQRVREIGIRAALGARERDILQLIMRDGVNVVLIASILGLAMAVAALRMTSATVFAVSSPDVLMFAGVPLVLAVVVLLACYVPARRAARVDPIVALREL